MRSGRAACIQIGAAIEEAALLATVQLEGALGTLTVGIETTAEHGAAIRATRAVTVPTMRGCAAELIGARTALRGLRSCERSFFSCFSASR